MTNGTGINGDRQVAPSDDVGVNAWAIGLGGLVTVAGAVLLTYKFYNQSLTGSPATIGAVGTVLGGWGIALSLAGFGLTYWQLHRTRKATTAVNIAIVRLKRDFKSFDIVAEIRGARSLAQSTRDRLSEQKWDLASFNYDRARESLSKILPVVSSFDPSHTESFKDEIAFAIDAREQLQSQPSPELSAKIERRLQELDSRLIALEYQIREQIGEQ